MEVVVEHRKAERRFVAVVDGRESYLTYAPRDERTLDFQHTWVDPSLRGQGVGERVVLAALRHASASRLGVIPSCWYVDRVVRRHPEFRSLIR